MKANYSTSGNSTTGTEPMKAFPTVDEFNVGFSIAYRPSATVKGEWDRFLLIGPKEVYLGIGIIYVTPEQIARALKGISHDSECSL